MKNIKTIRLAVAALVVATSMTAWSQTSQPASAPGRIRDGRRRHRPQRKSQPCPASAGLYRHRKHKEISAGNISVIAKDGAVTLNGTVTDASQVGKVADIAKGVPGVTSVTNKLTVQKPFGGM